MGDERPEPLAELAGMDRQIAAAARAWREHRARLAKQPGVAWGQDPLLPYRSVAGKTAYDALRAMSPSAVDLPWRDALLRWVHVLTERRITEDLEADAAVASAESSARLDFASPRLVSWTDAWRGIVMAATRREAEAWLEAARLRGPAIAAVHRERAARSSEVARRLGLAHPFSLGTKMSNDALRRLARAILDATHDIARAVHREVTKELPTPSAVDAIRSAVARDAPEGWPARLTSHWFDEIFPGLTDGLRLRIDLPDVCGAASFARGLGSFGHAVRVAGAAPSLPFAWVHDPAAVDPHRFALVFGGLPAQVAFQRRVLGLSARVAAAQTRAMWRVNLLEVRAIAVRALLTDPLAFAGAGDFEELTGALFGVPLPGDLRGAWPSRHPDGWVPLLAVATVPSLAKDLVSRYDDDWFKNPRAVRFLRGRASGPGRQDSDGEEIDAAASSRALAFEFERALG